MLSTQEASDRLVAEGFKLTSDEIANLSRQGVFPGASKDSSGRWQIPPEALDSYVRIRKRRNRMTRWATAGTIVTILSIFLASISSMKDGLDLVREYILPKPTAVATTTVALTSTRESPYKLVVLVHEVASGVGDVEKVVETEDRRSIIIFGEKHDSRRGQVEIAIMLNRLYETYGLRHIGQEGVFAADGMLDATWFHPSLHASQVLSPKEQVVVQLLVDGEISSGEAMALIYPDFGVHGVEKASEYNIDLPSDAFAAPVIYLVAIAEATISSDEIEVANELIKQDRVLEAVEYIVGTNELTKEWYAILTDDTRILSSAEMIVILDDIEAEAERVRADLKAQDQENFHMLKTFFSRAVLRSETMGENTLELASVYPDAPVAIIIGATHTERISRFLTESGVSFAVLRPRSLAEGDAASELLDEAFARKSSGLSVDPAGGLGSLLDGRRKPPPIFHRVWFRSKAETYFLTALVARTDSKDHPLLSTQLSNQLTQMQYVAPLPNSFHAVRNEMIFSVRAQVEDLSSPAEVWVRTTPIRSPSVLTLESALQNGLSGYEISNLPELPTEVRPVYVTNDVLAIFSIDPSIVENTSLVR